jgi:hypothetical protein
MANVQLLNGLEAQELVGGVGCGGWSLGVLVGRLVVGRFFELVEYLLLHHYNYN